MNIYQLFENQSIDEIYIYHGEEPVHMQEREDAPAGGGLLVDGGGPVTRAKAREMKKSSSRE